MKQIEPTDNKQQWPRKAVEYVETRKLDFVVRITDWSKDRYEPGFDVEVYIGGVYDWNESKIFTATEHGTLEAAKAAAAKFASNQIVKLL